MVKRRLVERLITDGGIFLCELDRRNFPVESMFWFHLDEEDYWRLVIASPTVSEEGSRAGYRRLGECLREIDELAGLTLEDISVFGPESAQFQSFFSLARNSGRLAASEKWLELNDAVVYRWTGAAIRGKLTCDASESDLNQFWKAERKLSKLPPLLIRVDEREFTLRFHPQHGALDGIEGVKQPFAIALHRPDARPDCQIQWRD